LLSIGISPINDQELVSVNQYVVADKIKNIKNSPIEDQVSFVMKVKIIILKN
jgi:hypothetical protein